MKIRPSLVITFLVNFFSRLNIFVKLLIIFIQLLSIPILGQRRKIGMSQKKMMMGGGVRTGTRVRPTTTLGLPGYQGRQSGAGNNKEITLGAGGLKKKKKGPSKSKADSLLNLLDVRGVATNAHILGPVTEVVLHEGKTLLGHTIQFKFAQ